MGPTWVLSAPDGPHVGPMNLAIRDDIEYSDEQKNKAHQSNFELTIDIQYLTLLCELWSV